MAEKTNFPQQGDDKAVNLSNSRFGRFPLDEAESLRTEYPEIWRKGGNVLGNTQYQRLKPMAKERRAPRTPTEDEAVRLREAWAARHFGDFQLAGVVAQVKWLVVGSRGLDHMREVIREAKAKADD